MSASCTVNLKSFVVSLYHGVLDPLSHRAALEPPGRGGSRLVWVGIFTCDDHAEAARPEGQSLAAGGKFSEI